MVPPPERSSLANAIVRFVQRRCTEICRDTDSGVGGVRSGVIGTGAQLLVKLTDALKSWTRRNPIDRQCGEEQIARRRDKFYEVKCRIKVKYSNMACNYFSIEDSKLRWTGDLEELMYFVANELNLTEKWTSLVGDVKAFSNDNDSVAEDEIIKIKWSQGKKIVTMLGSKSQEIEEKINDEIQKISQISIDQSATNQTKLQYLHNQKLTEAINEIKVQFKFNS